MSWQAGGPREQIPVQVQRPEKQESQWCASCLRSGRLGTQGELMFQPEFEGKKKAGICIWKQSARRTLSYLGDSHPLCSIQAFNWLDEAHPHQGGPFALLDLLIKRLHSSKNALIETPRIMFNQISGFLVAQSCCPIKLNITW